MINATRLKARWKKAKTIGKWAELVAVLTVIVAAIHSLMGKDEQPSELVKALCKVFDPDVVELVQDLALMVAAVLNSITQSGGNAGAAALGITSIVTACFGELKEDIEQIKD